MIIFSAVCRNTKLVQTIREALEREFQQELEFTHVDEIDEIQTHLMYEMPQFVLFDLDDEQIQALDMIKRFVEDPWLTNIGVFGLTTSIDQPSPIIPGVFSTITPAQINSLLPHVVSILNNNEQLLLQTGLIQELGREGTFAIENKPHLLEAYSELMTFTLYNKNYIDMQGKYGVKFSLVEMLMNAVEHGNCKINSKEKQQWLEQGKDMMSLILAKIEDPEIAKTRVYLSYKIEPSQTTFIIRDEGEGFDTSSLPNPTDPMSILDLHGRGVFMTRNYVSSLTYNEKGNEVTLVVNHAKNVAKSIPEGLRKSQIIDFQPGEVVFKENDKSDTLYYIVSGDFDVSVEGKAISRLNNTHVFLGEMAFLLGKRRTATVTAHNVGRLVAISAREWMDAVQHFPYYGIFLARLLAKKLHQLSQKAII